METFQYKKFKDSAPDETLYHIQSILHKIGLLTIHEWIENEYEGCYSNRVSIYPTQLGTNGKGTDRIFALTSGYAELMERIQNNILYIGELDSEDKAFKGFIQFPDQILLSFEKIIDEKNIFMENLFEHLNCTNMQEKKNVLRRFANIKNGTDTESFCIPFVNLKKQKLEYLPLDMLFAVHGSNGMSAGNTMEEALVQGIAEIFERYVNRKISIEHICPPSVPREYLKVIPSLNALIEKIEQDSKYRVVVKDCSLGKGFPVVAIVIINQQTGTFGVKFASHPSFSVALERTLTEAFQGKRLEQFTAANTIGNEKQVAHRDNILNMMKIGNGVFPKEFLSGTPDYEFSSFDQNREKSNAEMLKNMLNLIEAEGYQVLIHDSSYLGFHSYFTVIPGMSEMYPIDWLRIREQQTYAKLVDSLSHLHSLNEEELERVVRYISFKENSMLENQIAWMSGRPFTNRFPGKDCATILLKALCLYQLEKYQEAVSEFSRVVSYFEQNGKESEKIFYRCCYHFMYYRALGTSAEVCSALVKELFDENMSVKVIDLLYHPKETISRFYPTMNCFDCEHCGMAEQGCCQYPEISKVIRKIKSALAEHIPDQKQLLEKLNNCFQIG